MTIDNLGAIGDFIGGIAVIAGLVFVGFQLRNANREARLAANQKYAELVTDMSKTLSADTEISEIFLKGLNGLESLDQVERLRFITLTSGIILRNWESLYSYKREGRLESRLWNGAETMLHSLIDTKGFKDIWEIRSSWFEPSFQSYVNRLLTKKSNSDLLHSYGVTPVSETDI